MSQDTYDISIGMTHGWDLYPALTVTCITFIKEYGSNHAHVWVWSEP
jgi:hypothetical protein